MPRLGYLMYIISFHISLYFTLEASSESGIDAANLQNMHVKKTLYEK